MLQATALRASGKAQTVLLQDHPEKGCEDDIISTQSLRSQKTILSHEDEQELFEKVLLFLREFFKNQAFSVKVKNSLRRDKPSEVVSPSDQNERILSFKKMNMGSRICFEGEITRKESPKREREGKDSVRGKCKKISIFVMEEDYSESSEDVWSDSLNSFSSIKTIRSIQLPQMDLSKETIASIYEEPQPFLINLSLCLMMRYCLSSKRKVCLEDSAWVLSVATVVAYKLYYDEEIEGLIDCFTGVMNVSKKDLIDLERCFLEEINYNTVVYNHDYHFILANLLSFEVKKQE